MSISRRLPLMHACMPFFLASSSPASLHTTTFRSNVGSSRTIFELESLSLKIRPSTVVYLFLSLPLSLSLSFLLSRAGKKDSRIKWAVSGKKYLERGGRGRRKGRGGRREVLRVLSTPTLSQGDDRRRTKDET